MTTQLPTDIKLHKASKTLSLKYASGEEHHLPAEFLRVHSPSAEVQGHGKPILQFGKIGVGLTKVEPAGQYALKLTFDDGHDSGLFTWEYLYQLGVRQRISGTIILPNSKPPERPAIRTNPSSS